MSAATTSLVVARVRVCGYVAGMDTEPEMRFDSWHTNDLAWLLDELTIEPAGAMSADTQERIVRAARAELERRRSDVPDGPL